MSDEENLGEPLLDLLLYAPIGLLLAAKDSIPKLVDRGRSQVARTQLANEVASNRGRDTTMPLSHRVFEAAGAALGSMIAHKPRKYRVSDELENHSESKADDASLPIEHCNAFSMPQLLANSEVIDQQQLDAILAYEQMHRDHQTVTNPNRDQPNQATEHAIALREPES